jgi:predicted DNA-binding protein
MATTVDPAARAGRFSRRLVVAEDPAVAHHLESLAQTVGTSTAAIVRSAIRAYLRQVDPPRRAR